ncbi:hypothetical protein H311_01012, partial [Anncaliia algerae PRA109]
GKNVPKKLVEKILIVNKSLKDITIYKCKEFYLYSKFPINEVKYGNEIYKINESFEFKYKINNNYTVYDVYIENEVFINGNLSSEEFKWLVFDRLKNEFVIGFPYSFDEWK